MKPLPVLHLDHIAITARTLEEGCAYVRKQLGINMPSGGSHPVMGTHNRLLALSDDFFLEVIAIDPSAPNLDRSRWYALDDFDDSPRINTWILNSSDLQASVKYTHPDIGSLVNVARGDLSWLITVPTDGSMPMNGAFPTLLEWPAGTHPAKRMSNLGCSLVKLIITHPEVDQIIKLLETVFVDDRVIFEQGDFDIKATIKTASGHQGIL